LLKQPAFRQQILNPEFVNLMYEDALGLRQESVNAEGQEQQGQIAQGGETGKA
jgi:hypothetical protein